MTEKYWSNQPPLAGKAKKDLVENTVRIIENIIPNSLIVNNGASANLKLRNYIKLYGVFVPQHLFPRVYVEKFESLTKLNLAIPNVFCLGISAYIIEAIQNIISKGEPSDIFRMTNAGIDVTAVMINLPYKTIKLNDAPLGSNELTGTW